MSGNARRRAWAPMSCTLPAARLPRRVADFDALFADAVRGIERVGPERHHPGLRQRATAKLAEVEAKIADLTLIADTLRAALDAGCDDIIECAREPRCPIPFAILPDPRGT